MKTNIYTKLMDLGKNLYTAEQWLKNNMYKVNKEVWIKAIHRYEHLCDYKNELKKEINKPLSNQKKQGKLL